MTCINLGYAIVCVSPSARFKLDNRYVWMDYHEYCGPQFSWDADGKKPYEPADENDPIWPLFMAWLKKFNEAKQRRSKK